MKIPVVYHIRKWLNTVESFDMGWIKFTLGYAKHGIECELVIADCGRNIKLNADAHNEEKMKEQLSKISLLITSLQDIESKYEDYWLESVKLRQESNEI